MAKIVHPEYYAQLDPVKYPFEDDASLTNGVVIVLDGTFLDVSLYPIGGQERMYLSKVDIEHGQATIFIGDLTNDELASGSFNLLSPPTRIQLVDTYSRPAGVIVSETDRLATFQSWPFGTHVFEFGQTRFVSTVCVPTPAVGLRGVELADGTVLTGKVYIVGGDGIVVRNETLTLPADDPDDPPSQVNIVRFDAVGDPLFRRMLCDPDDLFATPQFLETLTFTDGNQSFVCGPDVNGDIKMTVNNALASDTILRVRLSQDGLIIEAAGI